MDYFVELTTRGYEADGSRRIPLPTMFQYLEHLRWQSIIDPRSGLCDLVDRGHFFVVHQQRIALRRVVGQDTHLRAFMWAERVGRSAIDLGHEIRRVSDGALVAEAQVTGVWLGPDRRLTRIPDALRAFAESTRRPAGAETAGEEDHSQRLESSYIRPPEIVFDRRPLDLKPPAGQPPREAQQHEVVVRPSDLDIFAHVNAATYLRFCDDARAAATPGVPPTARPTAVRAAIRYERETTEGERMTIHSWPDGPDATRFILEVGGEVRARAAVDVATAR